MKNQQLPSLKMTRTKNVKVLLRIVQKVTSIHGAISDTDAVEAVIGLAENTGMDPAPEVDVVAHAHAHATGHALARRPFRDQYDIVLVVVIVASVAAVITIRIQPVLLDLLHEVRSVLATKALIVTMASETMATSIPL